MIWYLFGAAAVGFTGWWAKSEVDNGGQTLKAGAQMLPPDTQKKIENFTGIKIGEESPQASATGAFNKDSGATGQQPAKPETKKPEEDYSSWGPWASWGPTIVGAIAGLLAWYFTPNMGDNPVGKAAGAAVGGLAFTIAKSAADYLVQNFLVTAPEPKPALPEPEPTAP